MGRKETIVRPATRSGVCLRRHLRGTDSDGRFHRPLHRVPDDAVATLVSASIFTDGRGRHGAKGRHVPASQRRGRTSARPARYRSGVEKGSTPQPNRRPLPLALSNSARASGLVYLYPGPKASYRNGLLHDYLQRFIYDGHGIVGVLRWPLLAGLVSFFGLLLFATRKDVERLKEMKYGRLLKGPVLVSPKGFNRAVKGDGVGFQTVEFKQLMRIPERAEDSILN